VQKLLDICRELSLGVLFGNAAMYVNDRFVTEFPDSRIIDRYGTSYPRDIYDYQWPRACRDYPEYRRRRNQLVRDYAKRFGRHRAVIAWDIHNEPFIGPGVNPCYCTESMISESISVTRLYSSRSAVMSALEKIRQLSIRRPQIRRTFAQTTRKRTCKNEAKNTVSVMMIVATEKVAGRRLG
jgi:hypothetical protein